MYCHQSENVDAPAPCAEIRSATLYPSRTCWNVAILNPSDELLNMQYYQINDSFQKESVSGNYIETELIQRIKLQMPFLNDQKYSSIKVVVGFMLDKKKLEILN